MPNKRLILAAVVLASFTPCVPFLHAQDSKENSKPSGLELEQSKFTPPPNEPYKITITFKATDGGKTTTQRSYSLVLTSDKRPSQIRDESQVPVPTGGSLTQYNYQNIRTNVDINDLKKMGDSVYLTISITTDDFANAAPTGTAITAPIKHSHMYTVSPTLGIGKLTTVYSSADTVNNTSVDVQVLVQLANAGQASKSK